MLEQWHYFLASEPCPDASEKKQNIIGNAHLTQYEHFIDGKRIQALKKMNDVTIEPINQTARLGIESK